MEFDFGGRVRIGQRCCWLLNADPKDGGGIGDARRFIYLLRPTRVEMLTVGPTSQEEAVIADHVQHLELSRKQELSYILAALPTTTSGP